MKIRMRAFYFMIPLLVVVFLLGGCNGQNGSTDDVQGTADAITLGENDTFEYHYDLGLRYLSEGNYEEAILAFTAAIEIDPKRTEAYVGRGDAHVGVATLTTSSGQVAEDSYALAEMDYLTAIDLNELLVEVYQKLADIYIIIDDIDSAIAILERGINSTGEQDLVKMLEELTKRTEPQNLTNMPPLSYDDFEQWGYPHGITVWDLQEILGISDEEIAAKMEFLSTESYDMSTTISATDTNGTLSIRRDGSIGHFGVDFGLFLSDNDSKLPNECPRGIKIGDGIEDVIRAYMVQNENVFDFAQSPYCVSEEAGDTITIYETNDAYAYIGGHNVHQSDGEKDTAYVSLNYSIGTRANRDAQIGYVFSLESKTIVSINIWYW